MLESSCNEASSAVGTMFSACDKQVSKVKINNSRSSQDF